MSDTILVSALTSSYTFTDITLETGVRYIARVAATNFGYPFGQRSEFAVSDGVLIDQSPPYLPGQPALQIVCPQSVALQSAELLQSFDVDSHSGSCCSTVGCAHIAVQSVTDRLSVFWTTPRDDESGIGALTVSLFRLTSDDTTSPALISRKFLPTTATAFTFSGQTLEHGARYQAVLQIVNGAFFSLELTTQVVTVDLTPPICQAIVVPKLLSTHDYLPVSWNCIDEESEVKDYTILIGSAAGMYSIKPLRFDSPRPSFDFYCDV